MAEHIDDFFKSQQENPDTLKDLNDFVDQLGPQ